MEIKQLSKEQRELLKKPLPPEAVQPHPTKAYLSTIKAIYVIERFNDVFGAGQWRLDSQIVDAGEKMVVVETKFVVPEFGVELAAYGGNDNVDRGDAYKGAVTDAVTKIGSYLGIGMDVFKGLTDKKIPPPAAPKVPTGTIRSSAATQPYAQPRITPPPIINKLEQ